MLLSACGGSALPLRSDMPLDSLTEAVTYTRTGPANDPMEVNESLYRGLNEGSPLIGQYTRFGRMSGVDTEDVYINDVPVLGMIRVKREYGYSNNFEVRPTFFEAHDAKGNVVCWIKIRHQFNRNIEQYLKTGYRDFDSLWFYQVPCSRNNNGRYNLDLEKATFYALVVNEVWQARIYWGSVFANWGHSVTLVGGYLNAWPNNWWLNGDIPNTQFDSVGTTNLMLQLVRELSTSAQPWVAFNKDSLFAKTKAIYSAGDADQYWTVDRLMLNRQREYGILMRSDTESPWTIVTVQPVYNFEENDIGQVITNAYNLGNQPFEGRLNEQGLPKNPNDTVITELEKWGCQNCPNATLEQLIFKDVNNNTLYTITFRGFYGANDTLVIYSGRRPDFNRLLSEVPQEEVMPERSLVYDEKGNPKPLDEQTFKDDEQWESFLREGTVWNWLKDNPGSLDTDLFVQFRVNDATEWAPIPCSDGGTCGYRAVEWNLNASYFFDGDVRKAWLISNLLGEVGVRTLGFSYASNRFEGSGLLFAQAQSVYNSEFYKGFTTPESALIMDARAMQLPDHIKEAMAELFSK